MCDIWAKIAATGQIASCFVLFRLLVMETSHIAEGCEPELGQTNFAT